MFVFTSKRKKTSFCISNTSINPNEIINHRTMTSVRIPFESYTAQMDQDYTNSNSNLRQNGHPRSTSMKSCHSHRMNNFNDNHKTFEFEPQITTFSINQVDEDDHEDPEEKMHSPRTPYGSVPDPINNQHHNAREFRFNTHPSSKSTTAATLYPSHTAMGLNTMQRTISASSFESVQSYSANSMSCDHDGLLNYAPPLSATNSLTRSDLKAAYSTSTSPGASPCATPKSYKLTLHASTIDEKTAEEEEEEEDATPETDGPIQASEMEEEKSFDFGDQNERNQQIEAIHKALTELKSKKQNGFVLYKQGLATYSASNSGANTAGTATPNSIGALSRSSSCESVVSGSECCFDDTGMEVEDDEFVSSGTCTPLMDIAPINQTKITDFSEDEMETPVPTGEPNDESQSPFDFQQPLPRFDASAFGLAQISEDIEHESMVSPNTNRTEIESKHSAESGEQRHFEHDMIEEGEEEEEEEEEEADDEDDEPVPQEMMHLEEEIISKGSRFESHRVLFLDVDGVLLNSTEQASLGREGIKFNDQVTALMCKLYRETDCDIVVSSTWQFYAESHLRPLVAFLEACGWRKNKIHTLLDLLPCHASDGINYGREWYEEPPYCRCRARGIQKIVSLYGNYITRWCCLDDLPLHSQKPVCIPKKEDIGRIVNEVSEAYFKTFTWRIQEKEQLMADIKCGVKYALTSLPNCLFCAQSYRFGYEYNPTMIYYQSDAIARYCKLTYEIIKDNATYQGILQNLRTVLTGYIASNLMYQGDPYIAPYLIQTNQATGITPENIENAITLLTYDTYAHAQSSHPLNDANRV